MTGQRVLLVGPEAGAHAARLELSGYRPMVAAAPAVEPGAAAPPVDADAEGPVGAGTGADPAASSDEPEAVILSPGCEAWIADLRARWGSVPLLLGIDSDTVEGRSHCLASGADDFWLTGMGASDLLTRLRLHLSLSRQRPPRAEVLQVADLRVLPQRRQARRGSRLLSLTSREYELLLLLARRHGQVVSREQILREIWDDQRGTASNVIEVYVRYLRQKLEEGGEKRLLHTVRGQGYCLAERLPLRRDSPP